MISTFKSIWLALFALFFIVGCSSHTTTNDTDEANCTNIEISEIKDSVFFNDIIDEYQYIPLSNKNGYLLGEIYQIIISHERIYVSSDGVFCFDMKGNPIFKINDKGGKKSEIIKASSISVEDGILYVYDESKRVIHKYNSLDGSFIENIDLPIAEKDIFRIKDRFIVENIEFPSSSSFYDGKSRFLICDNFSDTPQKEYLTDDLYCFPIYGQVTFGDTGVLFSDYFNNNVYKIDNKGCHLSYHINFKSAKPLPSNFVDDMVKNRTLIAKDNNYQYGLINMYENKDYLVGNFQGGTKCHFVYNKKSNTNVTFKRYSSSSYQISTDKFAGTYNDFFIQVLSTENTMMYKKAIGFGDSLPSNHPDFQKQRILMKHTDDDNPIIILYKFKNF